MCDILLILELNSISILILWFFGSFDFIINAELIPYSIHNADEFYFDFMLDDKLAIRLDNISSDTYKFQAAYNLKRTNNLNKNNE